MNCSKYMILPRFDYLREVHSFTTETYMKLFEVTRSTLHRDLIVLADLYDIEFYYNAFHKRYIRK